MKHQRAWGLLCCFLFEIEADRIVFFLFFNKGKGGKVVLEFISLTDKSPHLHLSFYKWGLLWSVTEIPKTTSKRPFEEKDHAANHFFLSFIMKHRALRAHVVWKKEKDVGGRSLSPGLLETDTLTVTALTSLFLKKKMEANGPSGLNRWPSSWKREDMWAGRLFSF